MGAYEEGIDPLFLFRAASGMVGTVVLFFLFYVATGSLGDLVLVIAAFFLVFLAMLPVIANVKFRITDSELQVVSRMYNKTFKFANIRDAGVGVKWRHITARKGFRLEVNKRAEEGLVQHAKRKLIHKLSPTKSAIILMDGAIYSLPVKNPEKFFGELKRRL